MCLRDARFIVYLVVRAFSSGEKDQQSFMCFVGCTLHCIPCCRSLFFWREGLTILRVFCGMHIHCIPCCQNLFFFYIPPLPPLPLHPLKCMLCQATEVVIFLYSCAIHLLPHVVTLKKIKIIEMFLEINCLFSCPDITALVDWA